MAGDTYYVTTPIYYVNDSPHIGHAYTSIACDALARFMRLDGRRVMFLTGTDEHGQKVEKSARSHGMAPQDFVDNVSQNFRELDRVLNLSNDDFIRTTESRHKEAVQALWRELKARGHIYLGSYAGWYCVRDEAFHTEGELTVTEDGRRLAPSGAECEWLEEPSYFFRLSEWQEPLLRLYDENPECVGPDVRLNEVRRFVEDGLQDLSISRTTFGWGIPVPDDPDHVMYVWLDALANYISVLGYPETEGDPYRTFWPADVHMVGKDILRFHAIYWPAFLMAAGLEPPRRVYAHGWWTNEGEKISKSLGNVIEPHSLIATYGLDQVRFFLLREVPFGNDGDFSHKAMVHRMNGELANDLGNLAQRVLSMVAKNCKGKVPEPGPYGDEDRHLLDQTHKLVGRMRPQMEQQAFQDALESVWSVVRAANAYVDHQAPWVLRKTDKARMGTVLYVLCETIRHVAILLQPFMPDSCSRMLDQLEIPHDRRTFAWLGPENGLASGTALPKPHGVFPRYVETEEEG